MRVYGRYTATVATPFHFTKPPLSQSTIQAPAGYLQMAESMSCAIDATTRMHKVCIKFHCPPRVLLIAWFEQLMAQFRIPSYYGGDESIVIDAGICNDTGSQIQIIYEHDFDRLNGPAPGRHTAPPHLSPISAPNGTSMVPTVALEIRILKRSQNGVIKALAEWMLENFVIRNWENGETLLLSGLAMRQKLYFATASGNEYLYVSVKKNGIVCQLPLA